MKKHIRNLLVFLLKYGLDLNPILRMKLGSQIGGITFFFCLQKASRSIMGKEGVV